LPKRGSGRTIRKLSHRLIGPAMNPQELFCSNDACPSRGVQGQGNIIVHDSTQSRYKCKRCGKTFTERKGTVLYRLQTKESVVVLVLALLAYGCPLQAIVRAFDIDERTVARWQKKAGVHCQSVHERLVENQPRPLDFVQADEIRVKLQKRLVVWMAMALQVSTRLWLGGEVSVSRDKRLIARLVAKVKTCALYAPLLLVTDGLASYVSAWQKAFRTPVFTGKKGRPLLLAWPDIVIGQVVKQYQKGHVIGVAHRLVQGTQEQLSALLPIQQVLNTAYIERINATFRQRLGSLVRRSRCLVRQTATLSAGMYLVGCVYNFCTPHKSLRQEQQDGVRKWVPRTPAMAADITEHIWTVAELLTFRVPPWPYVAPKRRGRPPNKVKSQQLASAPT
jgi:transposase-like protein